LKATLTDAVTTILLECLRAALAARSIQLIIHHQKIIQRICFRQAKSVSACWDWKDVLVSFYMSM
jgi:hypothetical protein